MQSNRERVRRLIQEVCDRHAEGVPPRRYSKMRLEGEHTVRNVAKFTISRYDRKDEGGERGAPITPKLL